MSIGTGLAIASSGLSAIDQQLAIVSQNIANANTAGYSAESATLIATTADGMGTGVVSGPATAQVNAGIAAQLNGSLANQSYQNTVATALSGIDQVMGTPGQGNDLSSLLGNVQSAFSTLLTNPASPSQQDAVVNAAQTLTGQINNIAATIGSAGRNAAGTIAGDIKTLNTTLMQIGTLNGQILVLQQQGKGTADLVNQRNAAVQTVASLTGAKSIAQMDGSINLFSPDGIQLPTGGSLQVSVKTTATLTTLSLGGQTIGFGGAIGGAQQLVNATLPQIQAGLDSFSQALASRFASSGLSLFTNAAGTVPATPAGFSNQITVNPAVTATPSLVRDGNVTITDGSGATLAPNPPGGPSGYATVIQNVLTYGFGANALSGGTQPAAASTYTDASGATTLPYSGSGTLSAIATDFTTNEASLSSFAQSANTTASALSSALTTQASATGGVSIDQQMGLLVTLQNAYAANAKIVSIAQQMWQTTESMIS